MKKSKRVLSIVLALVMALSVLAAAPFAVSAAEADAADTGAQAPIIMQQPKDSYIFYTNWTPTCVWAYPTLRVGVRGGSGKYSYFWYLTDENGTTRTKLTNTYGLHNPELKVVLYTPENATAHYYFCDVYDDETGLHTKTRVAKVSRNMGSQDLKFHISGTKLTWFESDSYDGDPCTYYSLVLYRKDTTHSNVTEQRVDLWRDVSTNEITMRNGINHSYYPSVSTPTTYNPATRKYTMELETILQDKNYDDIEYKIYFGVKHDGDNYQWNKLGQNDFHKAPEYADGTVDEIIAGDDTDGEVFITPSTCAVGDTLTAHLDGGRWAGCTDAIVYEWVTSTGMSDKKVVQTSTSNTYKLKEADVGKNVRVYVHPARDYWWHDLPYFKAEVYPSNEVKVAKAKKYITGTVNCTFAEPKAGQKVNLNVSIDDSNNGKYYELYKEDNDTGLSMISSASGVILNEAFVYGGDSEYKAQVFLKIKQNDAYDYDFSQLKIYFNGKLATNYINGNYMRPYYIYKTDYLIKTAGCTYAEPAVGQTPDMNPVSLDPAHYTTALRWWYNQTDSKRMTATDTFESGKKYYIEVAFTPVGTSSLGVDTEYYLNGSLGTLNGEATLGYVRRFYNLGYNGPVEHVTTVQATITVPTAGAYPDYVPVSAQPDRYSVTVNKWYNETDSKTMTSSDVFEAGKRYSVYLRVVGNTGYRVDTSYTEIYINGEKLTGNLYSYGTNFIGRYKSFKAEETAQYTVGDVNLDNSVTNKDALILDRKLAKWKGYDEKIKVKTVADMNRDNNITNKDSLILNRYLAKWKGYEQYIIKVNV